MNRLTSTGHCVECGGALSQSSHVDSPYFRHQPYSCIRVLSAQRDAAIARAEKAETWIETHFNYLGDMETALCAHRDEGVPIAVIREWFNTLEWFDATTPVPTEEPLEFHGNNPECAGHIKE